MQAGLTTRSLETAAKNDYLVTDLSVGEASVARDALCRTLYSRLFTWLVARINDAVKVCVQGAAYVLAGKTNSIFSKTISNNKKFIHI